MAVSQLEQAMLRMMCVAQCAWLHCSRRLFCVSSAGNSDSAQLWQRHHLVLLSGTVHSYGRTFVRHGVKLLFIKLWQNFFVKLSLVLKAHDVMLHDV
jgi:hypothetical protein